MLRIGLTGSIASGKSLVTKILLSQDICVIDADILSRELCEAGQAGAIAIKRRFGSGVMRPDASLDRAALAAIVFSDEKARHDLEALLHPLIIQRTRDLFADLESSGQKLAVLDAAVLIESGYQNEVDKLWLVVCDDEIRRARMIKRDGFTENEAKLRMDSQMPQDEKRRFADEIIDNSGSPSDTERQVLALLNAAGVLG